MVLVLLPETSAIMPTVRTALLLAASLWMGASAPIAPTGGNARGPGEGSEAGPRLVRTDSEPLEIITEPELPDGVVGSFYGEILQATGGKGGKLTWTRIGGSLPPGLLLSVNGTVTGTPSRGGSFEFTAEVASGDDTAQETFRLSVTSGRSEGAAAREPVAERAPEPASRAGPASYSSGGCAASSDPVPATFCEDFASYGSTSELLADPNGWFNWHHEENITLDPSVAAPGHSQSVRYRYQGWGRKPSYGTPEGKVDYSDATGEGPQEVWGEAVFRFSGNFTMAGHPDNPVQRGEGFKLLFNNYYELEEGFDGPHRFGISFHNGDDGELMGMAGGDNWERNYFFAHGSITDKPRSMFDGHTWHTLRWHIRVGPNGTNLPHLYEWWFDGIYQGSTQAPYPGSGVRNLTTIGFGVNLNNAPPDDQYLWWQQIKIWYSDPGW